MSSVWVVCLTSRTHYFFLISNFTRCGIACSKYRIYPTLHGPWSNTKKPSALIRLRLGLIIIILGPTLCSWCRVFLSCATVMKTFQTKAISARESLTCRKRNLGKCSVKNETNSWINLTNCRFVAVINVSDTKTKLPDKVFEVLIHYLEDLPSRCRIL